MYMCYKKKWLFRVIACGRSCVWLAAFILFIYFVIYIYSYSLRP